jgi:hypothetical protein
MLDGLAPVPSCLSKHKPDRACFPLAVEGADGYELRWAPQLEDGTRGEWKTQPFAKTKGYLTITGFTPGTKYIFQVHALIHTKYTDWSEAVTKICQ